MTRIVMKISIEVKTENIAPYRYSVAALRRDGTEYFCFGGLWASSHALQKAEDYLHSIHPEVAIQWDNKPGLEQIGAVLYRGHALVPGESEPEGTPGIQI
jgi:hypothetical protein